MSKIQIEELVESDILKEDESCLKILGGEYYKFVIF
jgi:hypothetical protein